MPQDTGHATGHRTKKGLGTCPQAIHHAHGPCVMPHVPRVGAADPGPKIVLAMAKARVIFGPGPVAMACPMSSSMSEIGGHLPKSTPDPYGMARGGPNGKPTTASWIASRGEAFRTVLGSKRLWVCKQPPVNRPAARYLYWAQSCCNFPRQNTGNPRDPQMSSKSVK